MSTVVRWALAAIVVIGLVCALITPQAVSSSRFAVDRAPVSQAAADGPMDPGGRRDTVDGALDLYGNEVIDAFATYSLDPGGSLYEVHSPQTELPKLGSPKS